MVIFDEELVETLCDTHLKLMWRELWKIYRALEHNQYTKNKNAQEFKVAPLHLAHRMNMVYSQMLKRGLHTRFQPINPFQITDIPFTQLTKELKQYVPKYTKRAQIQYLSGLSCDCRKQL